MDVTYVVEFASGDCLFAVESVAAARARIDQRREAGDERGFPARIIAVKPNTAGIGQLIATVAFNDPGTALRSEPRRPSHSAGYCDDWWKRAFGD